MSRLHALILEAGRAEGAEAVLEVEDRILNYLDSLPKEESQALFDGIAALGLVFSHAICKNLGTTLGAQVLIAEVKT